MGQCCGSCHRGPTDVCHVSPLRLPQSASEQALDAVAYLSAIKAHPLLLSHSSEFTFKYSWWAGNKPGWYIDDARVDADTLALCRQSLVQLMKADAMPFDGCHEAKVDATTPLSFLHDTFFAQLAILCSGAHQLQDLGICSKANVFKLYMSKPLEKFIHAQSEEEFDNLAQHLAEEEHERSIDLGLRVFTSKAIVSSIAMTMGSCYTDEVAHAWESLHSLILSHCLDILDLSQRHDPHLFVRASRSPSRALRRITIGANALSSSKSPVGRRSTVTTPSVSNDSPIRTKRSHRMTAPTTDSSVLISEQRPHIWDAQLHAVNDARTDLHHMWLFEMANALQREVLYGGRGGPETLESIIIGLHNYPALHFPCSESSTDDEAIFSKRIEELIVACYVSREDIPVDSMTDTMSNVAKQQQQQQIPKHQKQKRTSLTLTATTATTIPGTANDIASFPSFRSDCCEEQKGNMSSRMTPDPLTSHPSCSNHNHENGNDSVASNSPARSPARHLFRCASAMSQRMSARDRLFNGNSKPSVYLQALLSEYTTFLNEWAEKHVTSCCGSN